MTALLVASTGGHLAQLRTLSERLLAPDEPRCWVTFDHPQSRSMLRDSDVTFIPYIGPRKVVDILRAIPMADQFLRDRKITKVYSTGSAIALSYLPLAAMRNIEVHYIESAARASGPSMTGRILARTPRVRLYSQYQSWADKRWQLGASVFDGFASKIKTEPRDIKSVVVSLGTIEGYGFRGLVEKLIEILPRDVSVIWQTGDTDVSGLAIKSCTDMPHHEFIAAIGAADVFVSHAGIGSALGALGSGVVPVLVPRRSFRGEHVDDHQSMIAHELASRGLAVTAEVKDLTWEHLTHASQLVVVREETFASPFSGEQGGDVRPERVIDLTDASSESEASETPSVDLVNVASPFMGHH